MQGAICSAVEAALLFPTVPFAVSHSHPVTAQVLEHRASPGQALAGAAKHSSVYCSSLA